MVNTATELHETIAAARTELDKIERRERREKAQALIGKCFKYRNCYSCPGPKDYWWLYVKVVRITADGHPISTQFQVDKDGRASFEINRFRIALSDGYQPITEREFYAAWKKAVTHVARMKP